MSIFEHAWWDCGIGRRKGKEEKKTRMKSRKEKNLTYFLVTQYLVSVEIPGVVHSTDYTAVLPTMSSRAGLIW